ncbi:hypothetical protein BRETT_002423 [Brettanomyces bruxellensis]|uniref:Uncharacterized protein n=1 Tax=Dekkera bruxellensis TaxID=5007 RepID=A0A871RIL4_DEKBR|nr:uncharacterized protein BRETT_002423 [Brettanomyces bruxellensis]QOU22251.1 hypothetical protein BRETT_002423 [Brettanomyces bruxellensis]
MPRVSGSFFEYAPSLFAFEYGDLQSENVLIFIGGLGTGFCSVPYIPELSRKLNDIGWSLIQIQITSSYTGWGTGSLARDSSEIERLVQYLKSKSTDCGSRKHVGIMGHSTGCQDTMQFFIKEPRDDQFIPLEFGIIQAPVSDRYTALKVMPKDLYKDAMNEAIELIKQGKQDEIMPIKYSKLFFNVPISAYRWNSLFSVKGDDDYFSPDLPLEDLKSSFGKFDKPLLALYSGADEYVLESVDKEALMKKFEAATGSNWSKLSKVVPGGRHDWGPGSGPDSMNIGISTVIEFVKGLNLE